ncbi:hypothetical protein IAQ61_004523 [Plenodomus lingam]|uniref:uncharacterized protein n=1 Tax=Leptosphaeria maculans TaxID=5022 RepID=UPI003320CE76|nr:hypothetical protein IAQ61_004523 [Plenodomus lingam]
MAVDKTRQDKTLLGAIKVPRWCHTRRRHSNTMPRIQCLAPDHSFQTMKVEYPWGCTGNRSSYKEASPLRAG